MAPTPMIAIFNDFHSCSAKHRASGPEAYSGWPGTQSAPGLAVVLHCRARKPIAGSELVVHAHGDSDFMTAAPRRRSRATVVVEHGIRAVVAVGRHAAAAGAEVVMRITVVDRIGRIQVAVQVLVEVMIPRNRIHVRLVLAA